MGCLAIPLVWDRCGSVGRPSMAAEPNGPGVASPALALLLSGFHAKAEDEKELTHVSATEPPPVEPSRDARIPVPAPESIENENLDPQSPLQKRKMKRTLDDFLTAE
jgi:hypothetical protein